jgi:hypothetical protein
MEILGLAQLAREVARQRALMAEGKQYEQRFLDVADDAA